MNSYINSDFREAFVRMPKSVRQQARNAYRLFMRDPYRPGLHFKQIAPEIYSVRVNIDYRALGRRVNPDTIVWFWIGSHSSYDKKIYRL